LIAHVQLRTRQLYAVREKIAVALLAAALLTSCYPATTHQADAGPDVLDKVRSIDLLPRYPAPTSPTNGSYGDGQSQPEIFAATPETDGAARGSGQERVSANGVSANGVSANGVSANGVSANGVAANGNGYELNFEDAPIATVAKAVLGDILGVGYTIDPRVQGTITLSSGRPVPKDNVLFVLETALRLSNAVLVKGTDGYRLVPASEAVGGGHIDQGSVEPGYGISIVPLQNVSARTLAKLLENFATKPGAIRVIPERNLVLIQGTGAERRSGVETVFSFDTDWMRGQSVGIYPVHNSVPDQVIGDLQKIMDTGEGGLSTDLIKFQAIDRMNAVLAVTTKAALLKTVATWVARLDKSDTAGVGVKVYHVRYGEARKIARVLNNLFVNNGNNLEAPTSQIAPGSGLATASSRDGTNAASSSEFGSAKTSTRSLGEMTANLRQTAAKGVGADTEEPASNGTPILKDVRITADPVTNTLLIYASQQNYRIIERTLHQIDRPQLQVAINATIAEVTLNDQLSYGVQFFLTSHNLGLKSNIGSVANSGQDASALNVANVVGPVLSHVFPGFNFLIGNENQPNIILDALHDVTNVKVLSNPSVVVVDNEPAVLQVGDEVPVSTGSATVLTGNNTIVNTIDYRNTGVILQVVPRINVNGSVVLDIQQEISNVSNTATASSLTPTVSQRKVRSTISVAGGQTVLLAGLIQDRQDRDHPGIPELEKIPIIGDALSHSSATTSRTELIIFIRPEIIRNSVDAHFVAEELRSKLRGNFTTENEQLNH
jgi:general secretion pathway protein D